MAKRRGNGRVYWREQGGVRRAYADFRDLGGKREALIPEGETRATTDSVIADALVAAHLKRLQERKRNKELLGHERQVALQSYAAEHLVKKAESGRVTEQTLKLTETHLRSAVEFFGVGRDLASIRVAHVQAYVGHLAGLPNGRKGTLSAATQRKYLNTLSNLYRRAQGEGVVPPGYNPVAAMMDKPVGRAGEAAWLETWEAALLLEAARTYPYGRPDGATLGLRLRTAIAETLGQTHEATAEFVRRMRQAGTLATSESLALYFSGERVPTRRFVLAAAAALGLPEARLWRPKGWNGPHRPSPSLYPLIATFLLTGGREAEVYGLQLRDVNLRRQTVTFRVNAHRRLKTLTSHRPVRYWPQLQEILESHIEQRRQEGATDRDLLFVSGRTGGLLVDTRKGLDAVAKRAGWEAGEIRTKMFRHTYCSARLQTLDRGAPVSVYTVARELGHGGDSLVKHVYGHLGEVRHRSEEVEYRIEQQRSEIPPERLGLLIQDA